jgi:K+-transporting ATPase ATPase B chain
VRFRPATATALLRRNMLVYGLGGVLLPFAASSSSTSAVLVFGA